MTWITLKNFCYKNRIDLPEFQKKLMEQGYALEKEVVHVFGRKSGLPPTKKNKAIPSRKAMQENVARKTPASIEQKLSFSQSTWEWQEAVLQELENRTIKQAS